MIMHLSCKNYSCILKAGDIHDLDTTQVLDIWSLEFAEHSSPPPPKGRSQNFYKSLWKLVIMIDEKCELGIAV